MTFRTVARRGYDKFFDKSRLAEFTDYINSLSPVFWYRFNEISGTNLVNYGSVGSAVNGTLTIGAGALNQTGRLGASNAYFFDGADTQIAIPSHTSIQNLVTFTIFGLVYANGLGENNSGSIYQIGGVSQGGFRYGGPSGTWLFDVDTDATNAQGIASSGQVPLSVWNSMFGTYNDIGDRIPRIYRGVSGVANELIYGNSTAGTGNRVTPTGATIGNFSSVRSWNGLIDEVVVFNSILTQTQMNTITSIVGT